MIKVDTEGAETSILRGAQALIRKFRPVIVLETMDSPLRNMGSSFAELEAVLRNFGYVKKIQAVNDGEWVPGT